MPQSKATTRTVAHRLRVSERHAKDDLRYAAEVSIWVRWVFTAAHIIEAN